MYDIPKLFRWATMDHPLLSSRVQSPSAVERARGALLAERAVLFGATESGKTSLSIAMARAAMFGRDVNGMYVHVPAFDKACRETSFGRRPEIVDRAVEVPILVVDELGAEDGTSGMLKHVLQERHGASRQTFFASILSLGGLKKRFDGGVLRRLFAGSAVIVCDAPDQPAPRSEVQRIALWRPWRVARMEPEAEFVAMPHEVRLALAKLETSLVPPLAPVVAGKPLEVDEAALTERQRVLQAQAAALLAAEPEPEVAADPTGHDEATEARTGT